MSKKKISSPALSPTLVPELSLFDEQVVQEPAAQDDFDVQGAESLARLKRRPSRKRIALSLQQKFEQFHARNPHVYEILVRYARQAKERGRGKIGIKCLFERARWYARFETDGPSFKLNNNHTAFYARLIEQNEADLRGLFDTREQRAA